jgi:hypothetical protein
MSDATMITIALIGATAPTLLSLATLIQGIKTHATFNSKMDALLRVTSEAAFEAGRKHEKELKG